MYVAHVLVQYMVKLQKQATALLKFSMYSRRDLPIFVPAAGNDFFGKFYHESKQ